MAKPEGTQEDTQKVHKKRNPWLIRGLIALGVVIVLGLVGLSYFFYTQYQDLKSNPEAVAQEEAKSIKNRLNQFMKLPDETPAVATVTDKEKIKQNQPFFNDAENGDKLVIFNSTKQVILYRPSIGKVVNSSHLSLQSTQGTSQEKH